MTNKRIILTAGDWIKLSDIPNEQVFNLVKQCFINAGFNDCNGKYAQFSDPDKPFWRTLLITDSETHCYGKMDSWTNDRQLFLSDVFNSVNGNFNWYGLDYVHIFQDGYSISPFELLEYNGEVVICTIKRIHDTPEAIISPKTSQWWDYEKGCAVGLPERGELVLYDDKEYEVIRSALNDTKDKVVLLCLNIDRPNSNHDVFWQGINNITPLDYKTPKQLAKIAAVENALDVVKQSLWAGDDLNVVNRTIEALYDNGLIATI